tara:strand:- start:746 stop:1294 length:549 start_codon:yes stop_codon:yes gene_type:complete
MPAFNLKQKYKNQIIKNLIDKHGYKNILSVPVLQKIVINRGLGEAVTNPKSVEVTKQQLLAITGQMPVVTHAKKAISNFKIRDGQAIGCKVTLRRNNMYDFLTKLIHISMPKIRDFRGVPKRSFDGRGNYTLGIKEDNIFPEIQSDLVDNVRGFDITFVTTAKTNQEAEDLLLELGIPFRKN